MWKICNTFNDSYLRKKATDVNAHGLEIELLYRTN